MRLVALALALALALAGCSGGGTGSTEIASSGTTASTRPDPTTTTTTTTRPSTTTTTARPTTSTLVPPSEPSGPSTGEVVGTVGYAGCSMSQNALEGYEMVGGTDMWSFRAPYGGGTIGRWHDNISGDEGNYWGGFEKAHGINPDTTALWWNLCTVVGGPPDTFENAVAVLGEFESRIPGVEVYVSAQPAYTDGHVCPNAGEGGPELMAEIAQQLVDAGLVSEGPQMGPLTRSQTRDGCHANEAGRRILGQQLLEFFG